MARPARRPGNLPAEATSFVGRRRELAEVRKKLTGARIVSLLGPGGVGKTRLAIRAATDLARGFRDGTWFVELAEVRDPALVANVAMAALDLRDQSAAAPFEVLLAYLRDKKLLLVVDNCEHLIEAAADLVNQVVAAAADVRVIATSREPLSVPGEHIVPVPPLELPQASAEALSRLQQNEAVSLFVERALAASGDFELTAANRDAVVDLCRRVDGLPLALELAAVRTRVLSVEQILERLSDRFALLTGGGHAALPRHQTLQTAIDWSYELLTEPERTLMRRLCVFAGRFTLEDVEAICVDGGRPGLELMSSLVDKSLVVKEDVRGVACYRLHETMREYAAQKLREAGEVEAVEDRFAAYFVAKAEATGGVVARFRLLEWLGWAELEIDNVRAVLRNCLDQGDSVRGIQLATSMGWYWITRGTSEGVRWLDELLASGPGNPETLAWTYFILGFLGVLRGDWARARPALKEGIAIAADHNQPVPMTHSLAIASIAENLAGDRTAASRLLEEAMDAAAVANDVPSRVSVLQARSLNGIFEGDPAAIFAAASEGERLSRETGDLYSRHMMLLNLGGAALFAGDMVESKQRYEAALRIAYQLDDRIGELYLLAALAYHAATAGGFRIAAQLLGASETIRISAGASIIEMLAPFIVQAQDLATESLGEAKYRAEFETGRALTREAAVRLALGESPARVDGSLRTESDLLGKREKEVAGLVAEGLSNKQIAARLFLSERTVDSHVRSILNKLGFNSRAQIAAWISSRADLAST